MTNCVEQKVLDLGSLRAVGARDLLLKTEDPSRVQQRGRWMNVGSMHIYFQELSSTTLFSQLCAKGAHRRSPAVVPNREDRPRRKLTAEDLHHNWFQRAEESDGS